MRNQGAAALPMAVLTEALDCLIVRAKWYPARGHAVPEKTARAIRILTAVLEEQTKC